MPGVHLSSSGQVTHDDLPTMRGLGDWIAQLVSGHGSNAVYTTALINAEAEMVDWPGHEDRLVQGAKDMHSANSEMYTGLIEAMDGAEGQLRVMLRQHAQAALRAYLSSHAKTLPAFAYVLMRDAKTQCQEQGTGLPVLLDSIVLPISPMTGLCPDGGAYVLISGQPRDLAHVKHSVWMQQRAGLDALKTRAGAAEVLLPDVSGQALLEGLITNFAVIKTNTQGTGNLSSVVVQAASTDVLPGLALRRALQAAKELGWEVQRHPPLITDRDEWKAAFICNSLRAIVGISLMTCPGDDIEHPQWQLTLPEEGRFLIRTLQDKVQQLQQEAVWRVDHPGWSTN